MPILREKHTKEFFARCDECGLDFRGLFKEKDDLIEEIEFYSWTIKNDKIICPAELVYIDNLKDFNYAV